jgi:hypothetical protein
MDYRRRGVAVTQNAGIALRTEKLTRKDGTLVKWKKGQHLPDVVRVSKIARDNGESLGAVDFINWFEASAYVYGMEQLGYAIAEETITEEAGA